jgi:cytochrome c oxidase subunit IV
MIIRFLAVIVTGLAVIAPAAHLFELSGKIQMSEQDYFAVQRIYLGWWMAGLLLPAALILNVALALAVRADRLALVMACVAAALIVINLAIFVIWTQPVNTVTENWAVRVEDWQALRRQWEYSHAVNAGVTLVAFCTATLAALRPAN